MMDTRIVFDKEFEFALKFKWEDGERISWLNFEAVEVVSNYENNKLIFNNYEMGRGYEDKTYSFEESYEKYPLCSGFIKWDGCMEIHGFNHHFCGYDTFAQRLVEAIYLSAKDIMKDNFDCDLANIKN